MKQAYRITVGNGFDRNNTPILPACLPHWIEAVEHYAGTQFGGATLTPGIGVWVNGAGKTVREPVTVVTIYADEPRKQFVRTFAIDIGRELNQCAVTVEGPEGVEFIEIDY